MRAGFFESVVRRRAVIFSSPTSRKSRGCRGAEQSGNRPDDLRHALQLTTKYDLVALTINDPRERELAIGLLTIEDAETGSNLNWTLRPRCAPAWNGLKPRGAPTDDSRGRR